MPFSFRAAVFLGLAAVVSGQETGAGSADFFETRIRPILANNCFGCHTNSAMGGLRVDNPEALAKGGKRGPAVVPGDAARSLLLTAVKQVDPVLKMPMGTS
jgi:hypothetical protein